MQPCVCQRSCVEPLDETALEKKTLTKKKKKVQRLKTAFVVKGEKVARSVQQQQHQQKNTLVCCLHYSISDLIIISAGGGRDEQRCRRSPEASTHNAHSHSSTDPVLPQSTDGTRSRCARELLYLEGGKPPRCMSRVEGS